MPDLTADTVKWLGDFMARLEILSIDTAVAIAMVEPTLVEVTSGSGSEIVGEIVGCLDDDGVTRYRFRAQQ